MTGKIPWPAPRGSEPVAEPEPKPVAKSLPISLRALKGLPPLPRRLMGDELRAMIGETAG